VGIGDGEAEMNHVLITGGAGFIGSHLCDAFLGRGYAVTAIDSFLTGRRSNLDRAMQSREFQLIEANVSQGIPEAKMELLEAYGLQGVLHFACPASPVDFDRIPFEILEVDSLGTLRTVDLALRYQARYVLASTSEIYGDPLVHPQKESYFGNVNTVGPRSCYDEAKRFGEAYVSTAIQHRGLDAAIARIFNTYGPRMRPDDGRVIPEFCMRALRAEPIPVCGDGKQTRSLCYIDDLVDGIIRLFESGITHPVNMGNPDERSVIEMAEIIRDRIGSDSPIQYGPARQDDPRKRCPDITRARNLLGWEPRVSLSEGLDRTIEYFRSLLPREESLERRAAV
jgi:nucleoside-diphosphate-sugar epimerase